MHKFQEVSLTGTNKPFSVSSLLCWLEHGHDCWMWATILDQEVDIVDNDKVPWRSCSPWKLWERIFCFLVICCLNYPTRNTLQKGNRIEVLEGLGLGIRHSWLKSCLFYSCQPYDLMQVTSLLCVWIFICKIRVSKTSVDLGEQVKLYNILKIFSIMPGTR